MNEENSPNINPDEWTEKELLKHLYREFRQLKIEIADIRSCINNNSEGIKRIDERLSTIEVSSSVKRKFLGNRNLVVGLIISLAGTIIAALSLFF